MAMTGGTAKLVKTGYANYGDTNYPIKLYVYYKSTQNIETNKSTVYVGMYVTTSSNMTIGSWTDGSGSNSYVGTTSLKFDGDIPNFSGTYWLAENKSYTVSHNADGTASTTIYWKWNVNSPWGQMVQPSGSFTYKLPTIPRKSTVSATNANVGSNSVITISRASSSFTHTLTYSFGSLSGTIATKTTKTSVNFALPSSFYEQIGSTATSKTGKITCETFNGSTSLGTSTCNFTATTNKANDAPTLNPSALVATDSTTYALTGSQTKFIKGYTRVTVATGAAARNSATLTSQKITNSGQTINAASGYISQVTNGTFSFSATDSRGYTTTSSLTRTLVNYTKVTCNLSVNITVDGKATINIKGNFFNDSFGAVDNTLTIYYRFIESGQTFSDNDWNIVLNVPSVDGTGSTTYEVEQELHGLDYRTQYIFQAKVIDKLYTIESVQITARALPVFDWGENDFNFNVPVNFNNGILNGNKVLWHGASYMKEDQVQTLAEPISAQPHGIILVFTGYDTSTSTAKNSSINTFFVSKKQVELFPDCGHTFILGINAGFSSMAAKYLYFTDTTIYGHEGNTSSGTNSGIQFNNSNYVLRYVIGV